MPQSLNMIGLFCEDIRVESGDNLTLIGILPDNINLESPPPATEGRVLLRSKALLRLCIYVRANFDPDNPIDPIELSLHLPKDITIGVGNADAGIVGKAAEQAKENGSPLAGVIMHAVLDGFMLPAPGIVRLEATIGSEKRLLAALNFRVQNVTSSNAAPQPSEQSQNAAS